MLFNADNNQAEANYATRSGDAVMMLTSKAVGNAHRVYASYASGML
jgi:hypothetical protein